MKIYTIDNFNKLKPTEANYGVVLSESHPRNIINDIEVDGQDYVWYTYQMKEMPDYFVDYHKDKLGITNTNEAEMLIDTWNQHIQNSTMPIVSFDKIIEIDQYTTFGVLLDVEPNISIIMMNGLTCPDNREGIEYGAGYSWQYVETGVKPSRQELKDYFNLDKIQSIRFQNKW